MLGMGGLMTFMTSKIFPDGTVSVFCFLVFLQEIAIERRFETMSCDVFICFTGLFSADLLCNRIEL